jgi:hypothetical protein
MLITKANAKRWKLNTWPKPQKIICSSPANVQRKVEKKSVKSMKCKKKVFDVRFWNHKHSCALLERLTEQKNSLKFYWKKGANTMATTITRPQFTPRAI